MITVYKYQLPVSDVAALSLPKGAEVLHVAAQFGVPYLWARVDTDAPLESRGFRVAGTGHLLADGVGCHLGSFFLDDGALVFHVFEMARST